METAYQTLVLNRLWQAVNVVGVERAFSLLALEHAQVIYAEDGSFRLFDADAWFAFSAETPPSEGGRLIHTVNQSVRVPSVLLLRRYDRMLLREMKFNRQNLFERDGYRCQYCGNSFVAKELNMDHVVPRDRGGKTSWENVVTSCIRCNSRKGNRDPNEAGMFLLREPVRPRQRPFVSFLYGRPIEDSWRHFIQAK
ncbi:MAG: HNH endonuclease [Opitutae bacterium]|jgi:5-methylcytosine-specific restriction endonuclease McrA|nr:HNH endonuclease [Opitutae bacterium]MBT5911119.1 HNH endonuclease [Opitutae bacterium]MBT7742440.1 HNH endonuclease [Opitutae bacterium]